MEPIKNQITVNLPLHEAFLAFSEGLNNWWPKAYSFSQETLDKIGIEPKEGGFCYEFGPHGFRCDWGRVFKWAPPHQLGFLWQINPNSAPDPNPDHASEVVVCFAEIKSGKTSVTVEHGRIEHHGEGSDKYREELASEYGWPYLLQQFQDFANRV